MYPIYNLLGWFWIGIGVLWWAKPGLLRGWVTWKTGGKVKWFVWGVFFILFFHLAALVFGVKTPFLRALGFSVLAVLAAVVWAFQSRARTRFRAWCENLPLVYFRAIGAVNVAAGIFLVFFSGKGVW